MKSLVEINQLRRDGNVEEAFSECKLRLEEYPDDKDVRIAMAWCCKSRCELAAKAVDAAKFVETFALLPQLSLEDVGESNIHNRFIWDIHVLFKALGNRNAQLADTASQIFAVIRQLNFIRPDKYYSLLADTFVKVKASLNAPWEPFADFIDWFDVDNLRPDDYKPIDTGNGHKIPALADRICSAYFRALNARIERGQADERQVDHFLTWTEWLDATHPQYQYTLYYRARILLAADRKKDAFEAIRPFVQRKKNDYWVWDVLSETTDDPEIQLSCCCRALMCRAEQKYLGQLRLKTARLMHELGHDGNARCEIRLLSQTYTALGWRIPTEANDMRFQQWYQNAEAPESNKDFYRDHLADSEAFLYCDMPKTAIIITHFNPDKNICHFVTEDKKNGYFFPRGMKGRIAQNNIYLVRFDKTKPEGPAKILTIEKVTDVASYANILFKKIEGRLRMRPGASFGFVGDTYIDSSNIADGLADGSDVTGTAILTYNPKRNEITWRGITLRPR